MLLLDEPVNGLDPEGIIWVRTLLKALAAEGRAILVSSHLMAEMALTADHLVVIGRGRLIADTTVAEFVEQAGQRAVLVRTPDGRGLRAALEQHGADVSVGDDGALLVTGVEAPAIGQAAADTGTVLHELTPQRASLEEAFMELTRDSVEYHAEAAAPPAPSRRTKEPEMATTTAPVAAGHAAAHGSARRPVPAAARDGVDEAAHGPLHDVDLPVGTFLVGIGLPMLHRSRRHQRPEGSGPDFDAAGFSLFGLFLGQLIIGALGVLVITRGVLHRHDPDHAVGRRRSGGRCSSRKTLTFAVVHARGRDGHDVRRVLRGAADPRHQELRHELGDDGSRCGWSSAERCT